MSLSRITGDPPDLVVVLHQDKGRCINNWPDVSEVVGAWVVDADPPQRSHPGFVRFMIDDSHLVFPNFTPLAHGRIEHNEIGRVHGARHEDNDNQQKKNTRRMLNPSPRFTIKLEKSVTRSFTAYRANLSPFAGEL